MAFEYNGEQHYKCIPDWHHDTPEKFAERQDMIYEKKRNVKKEELDYVSYHIQWIIIIQKVLNVSLDVGEE